MYTIPCDAMPYHAYFQHGGDASIVVVGAQENTALTRDLKRGCMSIGQ